MAVSHPARGASKKTKNKKQDATTKKQNKRQVFVRSIQ
jgi:hypothetical protein